MTMNPRFKKILVVDDDELDIYVTTRVIKTSSFAADVIPATSVTDAMDYLRTSTAENMPELIFLDLNMPGQNGLDFLEAFSKLLKEKKAYTQVALLMNVVGSNEPVTQKAKAHPLVSFIFEKPLTPEMLKAI